MQFQESKGGLQTLTFEAANLLLKKCGEGLSFCHLDLKLAVLRMQVISLQTYDDKIGKM